MKTYGDMTFPPGEYEAFRVDIGEAQGKNWWCVLYPPLCFVDAVYGAAVFCGDDLVVLYWFIFSF